ncbi:HYC_CC_PP family protein [Belliella pelovolcani]|uniref:HYC_CC_PP family protein n=1 Tax=Belliella pelovolcani TaxID=529505 RepID=UPI00391BE53E
MKSFVKISLLLFYVFFNAGLSYSMHFCEDDFQRINVFAEYKSCCESNTPMQDCCGDVSNLELPNADQQFSNVLNFQPQTFELLNADISFELPINSISLEEKTAFADSSPPIFHNTPIYIFCQVFLI